MFKTLFLFWTHFTYFVSVGLSSFYLDIHYKYYQNRSFRTLQTYLQQIVQTFKKFFKLLISILGFYSSFHRSWPRRTMSQFSLVSQKSRNSDCWHEHEKSQNFRHETEHSPEYGSKTPQNQCDSKYPGSLYWPPHGLQARNIWIGEIVTEIRLDLDQDQNYFGPK